MMSEKTTKLAIRLGSTSRLPTGEQDPQLFPRSPTEYITVRSYAPHAFMSFCFLLLSFARFVEHVTLLPRQVPRAPRCRERLTPNRVTTQSMVTSSQPNRAKL